MAKKEDWFFSLQVLDLESFSVDESKIPYRVLESGGNKRCSRVGMIVFVRTKTAG